MLPPWTKYIGVYADFSYQNLNLPGQTGYFMQTSFAQGFEPAIAGGLARMSSATGSLTTFGLMVSGRYGFFPNPEVSSFGQLQPYLGVGPVLGITTLSPTFTFNNFTNLYGQQVNIPINESHKFSSQTSVFPALGVEAGLRYLPYRNLYLDLSYRFLYGQPSFKWSNGNFGFNMNPTYSNHTLRLGVGLTF
jgi:opacity protein-like surface antigen